MNRPIRKVGVAFAVLFLALFVNLNYVQVVKGSAYRDDPRNQRVLLNEYSSPRGQIVVQDTAVAESKATKDELKYLRVYPKGPVYAPVTGYYSFIYGASNIEEAENPVLSGDDSRLFTTKLADLLTGRNPRGGSVQLTLNKAAQQAAYNAMKLPNGTYRPGAIVAMDPTTGAILAAVSTPSFDPNKLSSHDSSAISKAYQAYANDKRQPLLNRAFNQLYPPGSVFKVVVSAAALKAGIKPDQKIYAPQYYWPLEPGKQSACAVNDTGPCIHNFTLPDGERETCQPGSQTATLAFALAKSCNTAFAALAVQKLSADKIEAEAKLFGIDTPPPAIPLSVAPSTIGNLAELNNDPVALAQTAFGQRSVALTPLQVAMISAAVANNGTLMKPYLVKSELRPNLTVLDSTTPQQLSQVIDPTLDAELIKMMEGVVSGGSEATGHAANITDLGPSVVVGGKTGTADHQASNGRALPAHSWFSGFALVKGEPKIAISVILENSDSTGGEDAAPKAKDVMEAYLKTLPGLN
ncbi:MAG: penicillin-binding protein [Pseudonocardiales bacterium]|jgi:peptidoglycan glycosyltransferase|nr:penicillin-binding protein [Pseudonocardiales bacterium]